ncbi:MAG: DUF1538 domain-containing protein [Clostridiales bacterium]|nr:DUF1538 domain-containing protein [Clostridiales bacterium]
MAIFLVLFFVSDGFRDNTLILTQFLISVVLVVVGEVLFLVGIDNSVLTMGRTVGSGLMKLKHGAVALAVAFAFGFLCTAAEPDLQVLGGQVESLTGGQLKTIILIGVIAVGVGIFTVLAIIRNSTGIRFKYLILICYIVIFALAVVVYVVNPAFFAVSFDSGGVTTGPITVPFILAFGVAVAAGKGKDDSGSNSFGTIAICSVGPVIAMLIFGLIFKTGGGTGSEEGYASLGQALVGTTGGVSLGFLPIVLAFLVFQAFTVRLPVRKLLRILLGAAVVYIGLILFLTGVNFGFSGAALYIGESTAARFAPVLLPVCAVIGVATIYTEPAVAVLGSQVHELTSGKISKRALTATLAAAVGLAVMLSALRVLLQIDLIWFIAPGYALCLALTFVAPDIFVSVAFDSGGVASGPITAAFSMPLLMGACVGLDAAPDPMLYAFGTVAMVAMMPILATMVLGVVFKAKQAKLERRLAAMPEPVITADAVEGDADLGGLD